MLYRRLVAVVLLVIGLAGCGKEEENTQPFLLRQNVYLNGVSADSSKKLVEYLTAVFGSGRCPDGTVVKRDSTGQLTARTSVTLMLTIVPVDSPRYHLRIHAATPMGVYLPGFEIALQRFYGNDSLQALKKQRSINDSLQTKVTCLQADRVKSLRLLVQGTEYIFEQVESAKKTREYSKKLEKLLEEQHNYSLLLERTIKFIIYSPYFNRDTVSKEEWGKMEKLMENFGK